MARTILETLFACICILLLSGAGPLINDDELDMLPEVIQDRVDEYKRKEAEEVILRESIQCEDTSCAPIVLLSSVTTVDRITNAAKLKKGFLEKLQKDIVSLAVARRELQKFIEGYKEIPTERRIKVPLYESDYQDILVALRMGDKRVINLLNHV